MSSTVDVQIQLMTPTDPLMAIAWVDCLRYSLADEECLAAFRDATGNQWTPGKTGIDRMIDNATGADGEFLLQFIKWFNENTWGSLDVEAGNP